MLVQRRVEQHAAVLRADADAQAVADAERHLADGTGRGRSQRVVDGGMIRGREADRRSPVFERDEADEQPLDRRRSQAAGRALERHRGQHAKRQVDPDDRAPRHTRIRREWDIAQRDLRQFQAGVEAADREKRTEREDRECDRDDAPHPGPSSMPARCARPVTSRRAIGTMPSQPMASTAFWPSAAYAGWLAAPIRGEGDGRAAASADRRRAARCAIRAPA